jgi:hypothetical protein
MALRTILVAAIATATVGFVIGTAIERNTGESHHYAETTGEHAEVVPEHETHAELKPFGLDVESAPFVALAAVASLGLAAAAWLRPRSIPLLALVAVAMLAFAVLDVREVFHQADEGRAGLAVLAVAIAALHLLAAATAGLMIRAGAAVRSGPATP